MDNWVSFIILNGKHSKGFFFPFAFESTSLHGNYKPPSTKCLNTSRYIQNYPPPPPPPPPLRNFSVQNLNITGGSHVRKRIDPLEK
jgi:hypothetical protein